MEIPPIAIRSARWMAYRGLACGLLYSVGGLVVDVLTIGLNRGTALAFVAPFLMPVMFGVVGFLLAAATAWLTAGIRNVRGGTSHGEH